MGFRPTAAAIGLAMGLSAAPLSAQTVDGWTFSQKDDECSAERPGASVLAYAFFGAYIEMHATGAVGDAQKAQKSKPALLKAGGATLTTGTFTYRAGETRPSSSVIGRTITTPDKFHVGFTLQDPDIVDKLARGPSLTAVAKDSGATMLTLPNTDTLFSGLKACLKDKRVPDRPVRPIPEKLSLKGIAQRGDLQRGRTVPGATILMVVTPRGQVSDCIVKRSTGQASLDTYLCEELTRADRTFFYPATDANARPTTSSYFWEMPASVTP